MRRTGKGALAAVGLVATAGAFSPAPAHGGTALAAPLGPALLLCARAVREDVQVANAIFGRRVRRAAARGGGVLLWRRVRVNLPPVVSCSAVGASVERVFAHASSRARFIAAGCCGVTPRRPLWSRGSARISE